MGWLQAASGDFRLGLRTLAASAICSALVVITITSQRANTTPDEAA
jgi:hypothetical protein